MAILPQQGSGAGPDAPTKPREPTALSTARGPTPPHASRRQRPRRLAPTAAPAQNCRCSSRRAREALRLGARDPCAALRLLPRYRPPMKGRPRPPRAAPDGRVSVPRLTPRCPASARRRGEGRFGAGAAGPDCPFGCGKGAVTAPLSDSRRGARLRKGLGRALVLGAEVAGYPRCAGSVGLRWALVGDRRLSAPYGTANPLQGNMGPASGFPSSSAVFPLSTPGALPIQLLH